ncbi:MAG: hypothetical protein JXR88_03920 [Clostridia bacterium]|nr:hypothetical protein [Clostridia bacterium]
MKMNERYFVRIDEKNNEKEMNEEVFKAHIEYLKKIKNQFQMIGGGFNDVPGGMIIFKANNLQEANEVMALDPIIQGGYYFSIIHEWEIVLTPEDKGVSFE